MKTMKSGVEDSFWDESTLTARFYQIPSVVLLEHPQIS